MASKAVCRARQRSSSRRRSSRAGRFANARAARELIFRFRAHRAKSELPCARAAAARRGGLMCGRRANFHLVRLGQERQSFSRETMARAKDGFSCDRRFASRAKRANPVRIRPLFHSTFVVLNARRSARKGRCAVPRTRRAVGLNGCWRIARGCGRSIPKCG